MSLGLLETMEFQKPPFTFIPKTAFCLIGFLKLKLTWGLKSQWGAAGAQGNDDLESHWGVGAERPFPVGGTQDKRLGGRRAGSWQGTGLVAQA